MRVLPAPIVAFVLACCCAPAACGPRSAAQVRAAVRTLLAEVPKGDFYASHPGRWQPDPPGAPLYFDPMASDLNRLFADDTDYFQKWNCDPGVGPIRHIRRLGISPLGTHSPMAAKDSLLLLQGEWSGGFPCVAFTHSVPKAADAGSPVYGQTRFFDIEVASFDAGRDRWFSRVLLDLPATTFGVAAADGTTSDFVFQQYQTGMKRGSSGDWLPGMGPMANRPGGSSRIPGVLPRMPGAGEPDSDLYPPGRPYAGFPLFGRGPLGLTSIIRANHGQHMPYGEAAELLHDNTTLFDYGPDGRPRAFYTDAYRQTGAVDAGGKYTGMVMGGMLMPDGALEHFAASDRERTADGTELVKPGYWAYRFDDRRPELGWQLDPASRLDIGLHALNTIQGSDGLFLTSNWTDSSVSIFDARTRALRRLVKARATPHVAMGEPSGSQRFFVFLGNQWPYMGKAFGLEDRVFVHDIYVASAAPIEKRNDRYVEPAVVKAFRAIAGRDPDPASAFDLTASIRSGASAASLRAAVCSSTATAQAVRSAWWRVTGKMATGAGLARWTRFLARGGTYEGMVRRMAAAAVAERR